MSNLWSTEVSFDATDSLCLEALAAILAPSPKCLCFFISWRAENPKNALIFYIFVFELTFFQNYEFELFRQGTSKTFILLYFKKTIQ